MEQQKEKAAAGILAQAAQMEHRAISHDAYDRISKQTGRRLAGDGMVRIKIPKDSMNAADRVVPVCINGYNYFISRGETVSVPCSVADVLGEAGYL